MDWKTAIGNREQGELRVRGYPLRDLIGKLTYAQHLGLLLKGELPLPEEHVALDALLVATSDPRAEFLPNFVSRQATAAGNTLETSISTGLLMISGLSGDSVSGCMELILQTMDLVADGGLGLDEAALEMATRQLDGGALPAGFQEAGSEPDQVATHLVTLVQGLNLPLSGPIRVLRALEVALTIKLDSHAPISLAGAVAACLCELDLPPEMGNGFFLLGQLPALIAHYLEEKRTEHQGAPVEIGKVDYEGIEARELESAPLPSPAEASRPLGNIEPAEGIS